MKNITPFSLRDEIVHALQEDRRLEQRQIGALRRFAARLRSSWFVVTLEALGLIGLIFAAFLFLFELKDRQDERTARAWQLLTTQAPGNSGKVAAMEYLNSQEGCLPTGVSLPIYGKCWKKRESLRGINLNVPDQEGAYLWFLRAEGALLNRSDLTKAQLIQANLSHVTAYNAFWNQALLDDAVLANSLFWDTEFRDTRLWGAIFDGSCLSKADFNQANVTNNYEYYTPTSFRNAAFYKADFTDGYFVGADFSGAILHNVNVSGANFKNVKTDENTSIDGLWAIETNMPEHLPDEMKEKLIIKSELKFESGIDRPKLCVEMDRTATRQN